MNTNKYSLQMSLIVLLTLTGCASTVTQKYRTFGDNVLCKSNEITLGNIAVLPEAAWRIDQKEPKKRQLMAQEVIDNVFMRFPCGEVRSPGGIREFSNWSSLSSTKLRTQLSSEGIDTAIFLRIEELTPKISITFSLPFLWSGSNETSFQLRMISVETGSVLADVRVERSTGGPFNIRPADWSRAVLNNALVDLIGIQ